MCYDAEVMDGIELEKSLKVKKKEGKFFESRTIEE